MNQILQQYYKHINGIADTYAYCLMPNHFHLLVRIKTKEAVTAHSVQSAEQTILQFF